MGDQLEERRDYATAFQLYTESTVLAKESKDPGAIGVALCRSGYAEVNLNRAKEGFAKIEQGLAHTRGQELASARIDCYVAKSVSNHLQGLSGLPEAESARQNLPDVTPPDPLQAGRVAYLLANGYPRVMRVAEAKEAYAAEEKTFGGRDSQQSQYVHYANQGMFFWKIGQPLEARASQERSLDIERKRGDTDVGPLALFLKARISRQLGDVSGALTGYEKSLAHARELHDTAAEGAAAPELFRRSSRRDSTRTPRQCWRPPSKGCTQYFHRLTGCSAVCEWNRRCSPSMRAIPLWRSAGRRGRRYVQRQLTSRL